MKVSHHWICRVFNFKAMKISYYKSVKQTAKPDGVLNIDDYLDAIRVGKWQDIVLWVRIAEDEPERKERKKKVPIVTLSGLFNARNANDLIEHSGFICIDIDAKDQVADVNREALKADKYIYAMHSSVSGDGGFIALVKIDGNRHSDAFDGLQKHFLLTHGIVIDNSCKDVCRSRFVSYDPDVYVNRSAATFKQYIPKKEKPKPFRNPTVVIESDFNAAVNEAAYRNLFDAYPDYIRCAFALSHEFGIAGEHYFHTLVSSSGKYDANEAQKDYDRACNRDKVSNPITIEWLRYHFKQNNIKWESEETEMAASIANYSDNPKQALKDAGIELPDEVIDSLKKPVKQTEIDQIIKLIHVEKVRFNTITRSYEIGNEDLNDRTLSKVYTKVWQLIDEKISKDKVWTLIQNRDVTPAYNPILDWFEKNKDLKCGNEFDELVSCFDAPHFMDGKHITDYLETFLKKWLLGLIGSAHGTYSLMILVLIGEQGTNKTRFFRNLLPSELKAYYAESNLDEGKDSEILMCKKWLIVDDEFGGKSKRDATKLKRLTSQQTFSVRMPYGRLSEDLTRLAVLGGTSNEQEVINDPTGNRRIIPINIHGFDFERYDKIDKNKLFVSLYKEWQENKDGWFLDKLEIDVLNAATILNTEQTNEEELLPEIIYSSSEIKSASEIESELVRKYPHLRTNLKKVGSAMRKLGYEKVQERQGKKVVAGYRVSFKSNTLQTPSNEWI
jgi:predicted P-loop ATPase